MGTSDTCLTLSPACDVSKLIQSDFWSAVKCILTFQLVPFLLCTLMTNAQLYRKDIRIFFRSFTYVDWLPPNRFLTFFPTVCIGDLI